MRKRYTMKEGDWEKREYEKEREIHLKKHVKETD